MSAAAEPQSPPGAPRPPRRLRALHFDGVMSVLATWCLSGGFLDAWAHTHGVAESFFTPWHALFYSGVLAVCTVLGATIGQHRRHGGAWRAAVPGGYGGAVLGVGLMAVGGLGDLLWHTAFGIEAKVAAALSPPHLLLACGLGGVVSAPLRAAWQRLPGAAGWPALLPMVVSTAGTLSLLTLMTAFASPLVDPWAVASPGSVPAGWLRQVVEALGVSTVLVHTGWMMGLLLLVIQRWRLPTGSLTLVLTGNALAMSLLDEQYHLIPAAGLVGLLADLLYGQVRPTAARPGALRLFAVAVSSGYFAAYFLTLWLTDTLWWSVHLLAGSIVAAGLVGGLLSILVVPPAGGPGTPPAADPPTPRASTRAAKGGARQSAAHGPEHGIGI